MPEQQTTFVIKTQEEFGIGGHLGLHDQRGLLLELFNRREEQAIRTHLSLFDHRRGEGITLHVWQQRSHQGLESLCAVLKQPEEELVTGDHWEPME
jgi:hypothetical protein